MLQSELITKEPRYVHISLSNENETPIQVFFDDFKVDHIKSPVAQMDDYYSFELTFNSYHSENVTPQNYKYSSKEVHTFRERPDPSWSGSVTPEPGEKK